MDRCKRAWKLHFLSSGSVGSLYDSLASELEASDSGFCGTPFSSARSDGPGTARDAPSSLQTELERLRRNDAPIAEVPRLAELAACASESADGDYQSTPRVGLASGDSSDESFYYDMPSKAIASAVRKSMSAEKRRRTSPAGTARRPLTSGAEPEPSPGPAALPDGLQVRLPSVEDLRTSAEELLPSPPDRPTEAAPAKEFRSVSCSPILFEEAEDPSPPKDPNPPEEPGPRRPALQSACALPYSGATSYMPNSEETASPRPSSACPSSASDAEEVSPRSEDSLRLYDGPKLGEPGRPGTRDLEFSLKKMRIRRRVSSVAWPAFSCAVAFDLLCALSARFFIFRLSYHFSVFSLAVHVYVLAQNTGQSRLQLWYGVDCTTLERF